jgi:hypothetical protein
MARPAVIKPAVTTIRGPKREANAPPKTAKAE